MKSIKKLLVPTDFSDCSREAMKYAEMMARLFEAKIILVHVVHVSYSITDTVQVVDHTETLKSIAKPLLENEEQRIQSEGIPVEKELLLGVPYRQIIDKANRSHADMIVMGTRGRTGVEHLLLGSVAEKVVRLAHCPVLTVHTGGK